MHQQCSPRPLQTRLTARAATTRRSRSARGSASGRRKDALGVEPPSPAPGGRIGRATPSPGSGDTAMHATAEQAGPACSADPPCSLLVKSRGSVPGAARPRCRSRACPSSMHACTDTAQPPSPTPPQPLTHTPIRCSHCGYAGWHRRWTRHQQTGRRLCRSCSSALHNNGELPDLSKGKPPADVRCGRCDRDHPGSWGPKRAPWRQHPAAGDTCWLCRTCFNEVRRLLLGAPPSHHGPPLNLLLTSTQPVSAPSCR